MNSETFRDLKIKQVYIETNDQKVFFCKHKKTDETYLVNAVFNQKPFELVDLNRINNIIHCFEDFYEEENVKYMIIKSKNSFGIESYIEKQALTNEQKIEFTDYLLDNLINLKFLPIHIQCSLFNYDNIVIDMEDQISFLGLIVFEKNYLDLDLSNLLNNIADILTDFHKDFEDKKLPDEIKAIVKKCRNRQYLNYELIKRDFDQYAESIRREIYLEQKKEKREKKQKMQLERKNIRSVFNNADKSLKETAKEDEIVVEVVDIEVEAEAADIKNVENDMSEVKENEIKENEIQKDENKEDVVKPYEIKHEDVYSKLSENAYKESKITKQDTQSFSGFKEIFEKNDDMKEALVDEFFDAVEFEEPANDISEKEVIKVKESLFNGKTVLVFISVTLGMLLVLYFIYNFMLKAEVPMVTPNAPVNELESDAYMEENVDTMIIKPTDEPENKAVDKEEPVLETKALKTEDKIVEDEISNKLKGDELESFYGGHLLNDANPKNIPELDDKELYKGIYSFKLNNDKNSKKEFYVGGIDAEIENSENNGADIKFWLKADKEQNATIAVVATSKGRTAPVRVWRPAYLTAGDWMQYSIEISQFEQAQLYISTATESNVWIDNYEINYK